MKPILGGMITSVLGVIIGVYSLFTGSPLTTKWALFLIVACTLIGFLFFLAKFDTKNE